MATANEQNLVDRNATYASQFTQGGLALPPANKLAVGERRLTCMDARIDPAAAYGIPLGGAHVIRNAGGSAKEALRSLIISQQLLGTTEIHVIKHTGCGMLTFQNSDARAVVQQNLGDAAGSEVAHLDFLPFPELTSAVQDDLSFLRAQKTIPDGVGLSGWVYEVETGKVKKVA